MGIEQFLLQRAKDQGVKIGVKKGEEIGVKKGEVIGIKKGEDSNTRYVISNARVKEKLSIETIANIVGLLPERVRQILDEMGLE
jgi:predicted transposase YdaD